MERLQTADMGLRVHHASFPGSAFQSPFSIRFRSSIFWALIVLAFAAAGSIRAADEPERHVVLITIDGFAAAMFAEAKSPIPRIRRLATEGAAAAGMRVSSPSVTWPNHTTLVTGVHPEKHSVLYNGILARLGPDQPVSVDPKRDKTELVAVPTIFDLLHSAGFRTAGINWPCTRASKALDDDFPDSPDTLLHTTPRLLQEMVAAKILPDEIDATFRAMTGPARDDVWTEAACHVIARRKPHLLLFHLLNTDGIHHRYGPQSPASYTALALADIYVGRILDALDAAGIRGGSTVFVTSDHGFAAVTKTLHPNVLLRQAGLIELDRSNQVVRARVQVVSEGGMGMVYLNNPATREEDRTKVKSLFEGKEGIAEVIEAAEFPQLRLPSLERNRGMADLIISAKDGYGIAAAAAGDEFVVAAGTQSNLGYHGYLATNPKMNAAFVASGAGIKRGAKIGWIENIDVAPTIAHLLGQNFRSADGKVLTEILETAK
jgi:predicted AlkP superfamily pyrophosphatase or phosphodiesterase